MRESDPRIGCLAVPLAALAGFVVPVLAAAALGATAGASVVAGGGGAVLAIAVAVSVLRRQR